jgi:pyrroloquinoline-quinone synthase
MVGYAKEYYWAAKHVPAVMDAIKKNFPKNLDEQARATFDHNAGEEVEHIELWERFASALGITKKELEEYAPTETVMEAVYSIVEAAEASFEEGIAAMYAFEVDLPAISESKIEGLQKFYGLSSEDAHAYFTEHLAEEKHLCFWRGLLADVPEKKVASALVAAKSTVNAQNRILDGVVERYCPELCDCAV